MIEKIMKKTEKKLKKIIKEISDIEYYNSKKVLNVFTENRISEAHFAPTTGYGYGDLGRDVLDKVFAEIFGCEAALVRHNIISGTHALSLCLFGVLRPGDTLLSVTGKPYDTLEETIGIRGGEGGSLKDFGIGYNQVDLKDDGSPNYDAIQKALEKNVKMILIQRSKGYEWRKSLGLEEMEQLIAFIKSKRDCIVMVDNCYGEFVETREPTQVGADIMAGSLIKNPGGGIAPTGGYIAGKAKFVALAANRLTAPGIGAECGASLGMNKSFYQGIFLAPHVVSEALKGAVFCAGIFQELGYEVCPLPEEKRTDIIQAVKLKSKEKLVSFCQGIQKGSPVDSHVLPLPWDMPGYEHQVIMASGSFTQGSSIELSADGPIKEPYIAYMQGGFSYYYIKLGIETALLNMREQGLL